MASAQPISHAEGVITADSGTITPTPLGRTFDTGDRSRPNTWPAGTAESAVISNTRTTYTVTTTTAGKVLAQAGFKYDSTSTATGEVSLVVVAKK